MVIVYTTTPDEACAASLAEKAVAGKLAACANIIPKMVSIYRWQGQITKDNELLLLLKTTEERAQELIDFIVSDHPYDCPAVFKIPVTAPFAPYAQWVQESCSS